MFKDSIIGPRKSADPAAAKKKLDAAIKLHKAHMDGTEPTSKASQQKMMDLMMAASDLLA